MVQMIQINYRTLRGIIPLKIHVTHDELGSTFQPLMTTILPSLLRHCPFVTHADMITPHNEWGHIDGSRLIPFQQTKDILFKYNRQRLSTLEYITLHCVGNNEWTGDELSCLLKPQSNGTSELISGSHPSYCFSFWSFFMAFE
jgi:hypothetical protein